jgi:membrane-associated phospholipid phosphatase
VSRSAIPDGLVPIGAAVAAFAVLAVLVVTGAVSAIDQYAIDHWMPDFEPSSGTSSGTFSHQFYPHLGSSLQAFCNLWTFPASPVVSALVVAGCCVALARRGKPAAAFAWGAAWIAGNVVEVAGKHLLLRPALHTIEAGMRISFETYAHSFPSGHALRAIVTATVLATVWKRVTLPAIAWTAVALPALVLGSAHTPSDVLGGALVALVAILAAQMFIRARVAVV